MASNSQTATDYQLKKLVVLIKFHQTTGFYHDFTMIILIYTMIILIVLIYIDHEGIYDIT